MTGKEKGDATKRHARAWVEGIISHEEDECPFPAGSGEAERWHEARFDFGEEIGVTKKKERGSK